MPKQTYYSGRDHKFAKAFRIDLGVAPIIDQEIEKDYFKVCLMNEQMGNRLRVERERSRNLMLCIFAMAFVILLMILY